MAETVFETFLPDLARPGLRELKKREDWMIAADSGLIADRESEFFVFQVGQLFLAKPGASARWMPVEILLIGSVSIAMAGEINKSGETILFLIDSLIDWCSPVASNVGPIDPLYLCQSPVSMASPVRLAYPEAGAIMQEKA
ncbi:MULTISPECIES: hypothetical protein [Burkholderia]|uniref:hypothetical protein n=1 Tax=Burkholderia TaxID=32008 RepID=UPI00158A9502|nr:MULTISPECIES: hypothetical protein [Burkholderia]